MEKDSKQAQRRVAPVVLWRRLLFESDSLGKHGVLVGFGLSLYMNPDGYNARPAVATLARGLKISPRSVQRGLRELEGEGLIVGEARSGRPAYYRATVAGVSAAEALRNDSLGEGVSASTGGSDHQTHEVVKEIEKPLSNLSMNPGLIDRVLEERPGLRNWVLSGEGYQLADNAGVFREVARQKFDLQDAVIEELRLRALARADQQSGHR